MNDDGAADGGTPQPTPASSPPSPLAAESPSQDASSSSSSSSSSVAKAALVRVLPFVSLATGIASAIFTRRTPERAPFVITVAVVGWLLVTLTALVLRRFEHKDGDDKDARRARAIRFVALFVSQTALQSLLAFPIPFFARALLAKNPAHLPFVVVYGVVLVVVFWDPLYRKAAHVPLVHVALQAFAAFVAALTVLPVLGLDNTRTFVAAGVVVAVGAPLWFFITGQRSSKRGGFSGSAALALSVGVVVGAPFIPPAPLSLESARFGAAIVDKEPVAKDGAFVAGDVVFCHTAIRAPLGLSDQLVHVWSVDGRTIQTVPLDVSGGRAHGFRTWSRLSSAPRGELRCRVETALGQIVGATSVVIR